MALNKIIPGDSVSTTRFVADSETLDWQLAIDILLEEQLVLFLNTGKLYKKQGNNLILV